VERDLDRSLRFYRDVFGMEEKLRAGPKRGFPSTPGSGDLVTLDEDPAEADPAGTQGGIAHLGFLLADRVDRDAAIAETLAAGGGLVERASSAVGCRSRTCGTRTDA
jgi:catechol 2,3-dioxygenase-like lactoylglutathione lyase family enzyme